MNTKLRKAFYDTQKLIRADRMLGESTARLADKGTKVYKEHFISEKRIIKSEDISVEVTPNTTFGEARKNIDGKSRVAVLNFANGTNPGGGVTRGAMAQEECLCRESNLYPALMTDKVKKEYYDYNEFIDPAKSTDRIIYHRDVTVLKTDDYIPSLLRRDEWINVDVITCAAPICYLPHFDRDVDFKGIFFDRIKNILEVAMENDVDILVLGAFGCGAFNNSPKLVAYVFHKLIYKEGYGKYFKKIKFAVKTDSENPSRNFITFREIFS